MNIYMLTGDNQLTANAIADELGIEAIGEVLPQDKEKHVRDLQEKGHRVIMVGDGINDAPALVRSDVGIAMTSGIDIAIESADIVLMKNDLQDVVVAYELSKATIKNIKENLFWAFFYNVIGIPVAAGVFYSIFGWLLDPMYGAAAMSLNAIDGIQATVDLEKNCAFVEGEVDEATLKQAIEEAGYTYKGIE